MPIQLASLGCTANTAYLVSPADSARGAYNASSDPLVSWGGVPLPIPFSLDAFVVSTRRTNKTVCKPTRSGLY